MYTIKKENGKTFIYDWKDAVVWSSPDEAYVIYNASEGMAKGTPKIEKVGKLSEEQLLRALTSAIKLPL